MLPKDPKEIAKHLIMAGTEPYDLRREVTPDQLPPGFALAADLNLPFPSGTRPRPLEISPRPDPGDALPEADVVVITWTVAELRALADVLTPGFNSRTWYRYDRDFDEKYRPHIREGAPALAANRLGSYFLTRVRGKRVLCFKSELHLNQDGIRGDEADPETGARTTLPVYYLFKQIIREARPSLILTVGTSGGVYLNHSLGDVVVTRGAKFRCSDEFEDAPFNGHAYRSEWEIPTGRFPDAVELMDRFKSELVEPSFAPPTRRFDAPPDPVEAWPNLPKIHLDGTLDTDPDAFELYHPILTTDFFEFGNSANNLEAQGCAVEMGDAVLGLACRNMEQAGEAPPLWAVVRNLSDPQINADLSDEMQRHWAVWYYEKYGYWTSVCGALATWAILAGIE